MQIGWGETTVYISGVKTMVNLFCCWLCCSRATMVFAYRRQNEENFLGVLLQASQYFGGIPKLVILTAARLLPKRVSVFMLENRSVMPHWLLSTVLRLCSVILPASGNEKGLVESLVGYSRHNTVFRFRRWTHRRSEPNAPEKCQKYLSH